MTRRTSLNSDDKGVLTLARRLGYANARHALRRALEAQRARAELVDEQPSAATVVGETMPTSRYLRK